MKSNILLVLGLMFLFVVNINFSQDKEQEPSFIEASYVINIEVPIRVFDDGIFVDGLTMKDFEVFEDGKPQKVEAVYRVKGDTVEKKEEQKQFNPQTNRLFILFFEVETHDPRLDDAVDNFIKTVFLKTDELIVVTPMKTYKLEEDELERKSRDEIADELKELIRQDTLMGNSESRAAKEDIKEVAIRLKQYFANEVRETVGDIEPILGRYMAAIDRLQTMSEIDQLKLLDFAKYLRIRSEQKYVFLFYEKEQMPIISNSLWQQFSSLEQDMGGLGLDSMMIEYQSYYNQETTVDLEVVRQAYADASASLHFLFITKPRENIPGIQMVERANDVFSTFAEMAKASGGFVDSSSRPDYLFQEALDAADNYYLLYYSPKEYVQNGKFREIKVRVKGKDYKVVHRQGYYAY